MCEDHQFRLSDTETHSKMYEISAEDDVGPGPEHPPGRVLLLAGQPLDLPPGYLEHHLCKFLLILSKIGEQS